MHECEMAGCDNTAMYDVTLAMGAGEAELCGECLAYLRAERDIVKFALFPIYQARLDLEADTVSQ